MPQPEKSAPRSSTAGSKGKTPESSSKATLDKVSRVSDPKNPTTKSSIPPKRPLTTPRGPSFASDRSRTKPSSVPSTASASSPRVPTRAPGTSRANTATSTSARRTSVATSKPPVFGNKPRTQSSRLDSHPENDKESIKSPTTTEHSDLHEHDSNEEDEAESKEDEGVPKGFQNKIDENEDNATQLKEELEYLKTSLTEKTEEAKKESYTRIVDLESELEESQTKIREIEAVAETSRVELDSKTEALKEMQSDHQELQEKLKSINEEKERDLRDADRRHAQQLKEAASKLEQQAKNIEEDLRRTIASQAQELEGANKRLDSQLKSSGLEKRKELDDLRSKHLQELELFSKQREAKSNEEIEKVQADSRNQIEKARKELEQSRKVAKDAETVRTELQKEVEEARKRADNEKSSKEDLEKELDGLEALRQELEDQQVKLRHEHEGILEKTKKELAEVWKRLEEKKQDSTGYERELAELRANHDRELEDNSSELKVMRDKIARLEDFEKSATAELDRRIRESEESSKQQLVEANKQIKRLENASLEHEQHFRSTVQKHRKDLEERNKGHEQELKEVLDKQKELEYSVQQSKRELSDALKHQNEAHMTSEQSKKERNVTLERHQQLEKSLEQSKAALDETSRREKDLQEKLKEQSQVLDEAQELKKNLHEANEHQRRLESKVAHQQESADRSLIELDQSRQQLHQLEQQISSQSENHEREIEESLTKHKVTEATAKQYQIKVEDAEKAQQALQSKLSEHLQALESLRNDHEESEKELGSSKEVIVSLRNDGDKRLADLASNHDSILTGLKSDHQHEIERFRSMAAELESLKESLSKSQSEDTKLAEELKSQHQQEIENLKHKHRLQQQAAAKNVVELREALQNVGSAKEASEQARSDLETQLSEKTTSKDEGVEKLSEEHKSALKQIDTLQASLTSAADDRKVGVEMIRAQKKRIEALEQAKANTEQQLQVSEAQHPEFENLQQEYHAAVQEINSLKGSLANATKDRKDYLEAINEYRGKLEAAEEAQSSFEKNGKQVSLEQEKLLENMRRDHEEASQRQVIALQASVDKAAIERKDGVQAIRNFKNQISELSKSRDAANTLISQLQTQIQGQVASERSEGLDTLRANYHNALERISAFEALVEKAATDRKEGTELIRTHKRQLTELSKDRDAAREQASQLQDALNSLQASATRDGNRSISHNAERQKVQQERDAAREQVSKLQAFSRLVDGERNELAAKHALQLSAHEEALLRHNHLLEELAKTKALSSRKEHELHQRLRYLDTAHNESLANAASLAQQLHDAKAQRGTVDELRRQLDHATREAESAQKTDAVELRRHVSALGRHFTTNMADVETLRVDLEKEMEGKEVWFKRDAKARKGLAEALDATRASWKRPVGQAK